MPTVSGLVCFWAYSFLYEPLPTSKIFSTLALFTNLSYPIRYYMVANNFRIKSDLSDQNLADLIELHGTFEQRDDASVPLGEIRIEGGSFRWVDEDLERRFVTNNNPNSEAKSKITQLDIPAFTIKPGTFTTIIGKVGSGKTFLLHALMNELVTVAGTTRKHGRIAYIPQEAFLIFGTIKENILFGKSFDQRKYSDVLNLCELQEDLKNLQDGDNTLVGERGVGLSGG